MKKVHFAIPAVLFLAATLIAVTLLLPEKASIRVEVSGVDAKVPLLLIDAENLTVRNPEPTGKDQPLYLTMTSQSLSAEPGDFSFIFTPKQDGEVSIIFNGLRAGGADESLVAAYSSIQVIGAAVENAGFKLQTDTPKLSDLDGGIPVENPNDKSAPSMLLAAADTSYKASISVKNGVQVTVKFSARIVNKRQPPSSKTR